MIFVNDTTATSPDGTIAALKRFGNGGNIILIAGGASKGLTMNDLAKEIREQCKQVVLFEGTALEQFAQTIGDGIPMTKVNSMQMAIDSARSDAKLGDVILLSPGTASFGIFKNEFDRGDQFNAVVEKLKNSSNADNI